ncbi:MAG: endolytic transglycosylase MltG [Archangiaceae bacterium]|nr:endolytic transglycosylase MltG [Archangiaceae bacterium]
MKKVILAVLVLVVLAGAGAAGWWFMNEQRITAFGAAAFGAGTRTVEIPPRSNPKVTAKLLAEGKVVADPDLMYQWLKREQLGPKLRAGEYEFVGSLTPQQVADKLISGQVKLYHFTVPEGLRVDEILPILASSELKLDLGKLKALAADPRFVRKTGVPADGLEGFLFPDTYSFTRGATEESVLTKMVSRTIEEFKKSPRRPGVKFDLLQAITMASIVEKETGASELDQRPHISCVFHNRLAKDWRLDTDPTVIYAMMLLRGTYSKNITRKDLETDHPYNTYRNKGLPPGPIANPGVAAIHAALNPITCPDFFFVSKNDGTSVFCPDMKCHEANVDKYQRKGGGQK